MNDMKLFSLTTDTYKHPNPTSNKMSPLQTQVWVFMKIWSLLSDAKEHSWNERTLMSSLKKRNNDYILGFEHLRISHNISKVDGETWNSRKNIIWGRGGESDQKLNQLGGENSLLMVRSNT